MSEDQLREAAETDRLRKILPDRLAQALRSSGLSRKSLAEIVGVHLNTVHAYAAGQRLPRLSQLTLLSKALGVSLDWLLDGKGVAEFEARLRRLDLEILEYVSIENRRGVCPTYTEISHAFDAEPYWSSPHVRRLVRLGFLLPQPGFRLTRTAIAAMPAESFWKPVKRILKRTPIPAEANNAPSRGFMFRTPIPVEVVSRDFFRTPIT